MRKLLKSSISFALTLVMLISLVLPLGGVASAAQTQQIIEWGDSWDFIEPQNITPGFIDTWSDPDYTSDSTWRTGPTPVVYNYTAVTGVENVDYTKLTVPPAATVNPNDTTGSNRHPVIFRKVIDGTSIDDNLLDEYLFDVEFNDAIIIWINGELYYYYGMRTGYVPTNEEFGYTNGTVCGINDSTSSYNYSTTKISKTGAWQNDLGGSTPALISDVLKLDDDNVILIAVFVTSTSVSSGDFCFNAFLGIPAAPAYPANVTPPGSIDPVPQIGTVISKGSMWYYQKSGWQETGWLSEYSVAGIDPDTLLNDNDKWLWGFAPLGYADSAWTGDAIATTVGTKYDYKPNNLPYNFRKSFVVDTDDYSGDELLQLTVWYDDGIAVWLNGEWILWRSTNTSEQVTDYGYPESSDGYFDDDGDPGGFMNNVGSSAATSILEIPTSMLIDGENVIIVSVFNVTEDSTDLFFDLELRVPDAVETEPVGTFIGYNRKWEYLESTEPAANWLEAWSDASYITGDDGGFDWKTGRAPFGRGGAYSYDFGGGFSGSAGNFNVNTMVPAPVTDDEDGTPAQDENFPLVFRKTFDVADPSAVTSILMNAKFDDGIAVYLNGNLVSWKNIPTTRNDNYYNSFVDLTYTQPGGIPGEAAVLTGSENSFGYPSSSSSDNSEYSGLIQANPSTFTDRFDAEYLVQGENVLIVALFDDWAISSFELNEVTDLFFDLELKEIDIEPYSTKYIALSPGANESEINFTWWSPWGSSDAAKVQVSEESNFSNPIESGGDSSVEHVTTSYDVNRATVTGLEPNTTYHYRVGSGEAGEWSAAGTFTTKDPSEYIAIVVSDAQLDGTAAQTNWINSMNKAEVKANSQGGASLIIHAGDVVDSTSYSSQMTQYDYHFAPSQLVKYPLIVVPGNHDEYTNLLTKHYTWSNDDERYGATNAGWDYWYRHGDTLYLQMNANAPWSTANTVASEAEVEAWTAAHADFLEDAVSQNTDAKWRIVVMHFDVYGGGRHALSDLSQAHMNWDGMEVRQALYGLFDEHDIDLVINGHEHLYTRSYFMYNDEAVHDQKMASVDKQMDDQSPGSVIAPNGTLYITVNSASAMKNDPYRSEADGWVAYYNQTIMGSDKDPNRPQYSIMSIDDNTITFETYKTIDDSLVDSITIKKAPDYAALQELIESCETIVQNDFSNSSWNAFTAEILNSKEIQPAAAAAAIESAFNSLYEKFNALAPDADPLPPTPVAPPPAGTDTSDTGNSENDKTTQISINSGTSAADGSSISISATIDTDTGNVYIELDENDVEKLVEDALKLAGAANQGIDEPAVVPVVTIDLTDMDGTKNVTLNTDAVQTFAETGVSVTVKLPAANVTLNPDALSALVSAGYAAANISIEAAVVPASQLTDMQAAQVKEYGMIVNVDIFAGNKKIDVPVIISIPYTLKNNENPAGVCVWHLDSNGALTKLSGIYDKATGMITFTINHQSYFVVGYDPVALWVNTFSDINKTAWYYDAVAYVNHNGLFYGSDGKFSPQDSMTRAMFVTVLWNHAGKPAPVSGTTFKDVSDDMWFSDAVLWAASTGIVNGVGDGKYAPNAAITRQEMVVMLANYAKYREYTVPKNREMLGFADSNQIDTWAAAAAKLLSEAGVMNGANGEFMPKKDATRAEVAQLFKNFMRLVANSN